MGCIIRISKKKENTVLALALAIVLLVNEQINCVYGWMEEVEKEGPLSK